MPVIRTLGLCLAVGALVAVLCELLFTFVQGVPAHRAWGVSLGLGGCAAVVYGATRVSVARRSR